MIAFLSGLGALQGLFLALLLRARHDRVHPIIGWLMIAVAASLALDAAEAEGLLGRFPWLGPLELLAMLSIAPLLSASIAALMQRPVAISKPVQVYACLCGLLLVPPLMIDHQNAVAVWTGTGAVVQDSWTILTILSALLSILVTATALAFIIFRARRSVAGALAADPANPKLHLLGAALTLIALLWLIWLAGLLLEPLLAPARWPATVGALAMALGVYALGWIGLQNPQAFAPASDGVASRIVRAISARYPKSAITAEDIDRLHARLEAVMRSRSLHREAGLTLPQLAASVNASVNDVSRVLNETSGGFFDYVNRWRIAEAQALLAADPEMRVLDIAFAVGFNAKSTFNEAFRKQCGMTPSAYRAEATP